jgi:hypothetical protein
MKEIKITATLSPHMKGNKPAGFYLLAQRLFIHGAPILAKQQYIGHNGNLIVTVGYNGEWDSLLKMAVQMPELDKRKIAWFDYGKLYPMSMGFRMYIPGRVLRPTSADKIVGPAIFRKCGTVFYLELQNVTTEILYRGTFE